MRYTQGQIRDLVGLSVETLRAWRGVIPFLWERKGHSPTFTAGDLVAFAALGELIGRFGVKIGSISAQAQVLFELCHQQSWVTLEDCVIELTSHTARLVRCGGERLAVAEATWTVPCSALIARLHETLSAEQSDQGLLQFPPIAVGERP